MVSGEGPRSGALPTAEPALRRLQWHGMVSLGPTGQAKTDPGVMGCATPQGPQHNTTQLGLLRFSEIFDQVAIRLLQGMASPAASRGTSAVVLGVALAGAIIANCTTATVASSATAGTAPLVWKAPQVGSDITAVMADGNLLLDEGTKKVTPKRGLRLRPECHTLPFCSRYRESMTRVACSCGRGSAVEERARNGVGGVGGDGAFSSLCWATSEQTLP